MANPLLNISKNANDFLSARVRSIKPSLLVSLVTGPGNYSTRVRLKYGQWLHFYTFQSCFVPWICSPEPIGAQAEEKID